MRRLFTLLTLMTVFTPMVMAGELANPCVKSEKQGGSRMRSPTNELDWRCMRYQASKDNDFQQFYVGLVLIQGNSSEGKKISEAIFLLTAAAKSGQKNAIPVLAKLYYAGDKGLPANIELAYQWASLAEYPVKENMIIRGSYYEEDMKQVENMPTIMEKIEKLISPERAEELKSASLDLLK